MSDPRQRHIDACRRTWDRYRERYSAQKAKAETKRRQKDKDRYKRTGFGPALVDVLHRRLGRACAICRIEMVDTLRNRRPTMNEECADHCHDTGRPRGLICRACNTALGCYENAQRFAGLVIAEYESYLGDPPAQRPAILAEVEFIESAQGGPLPPMKPGPKAGAKRLRRWMTVRNSSGFRGVSWYKKLGRWCSGVTVNGARRHLGMFDRKESAAIAYTIASVQAYGFDDAHYNDVFSGEVPL